MRKFIWQAAILPVLFACSASAATLNSAGPAIAMVGGTITVTFGSGAVITETLLLDTVIGSAYAHPLGKFHFEVKGDTFIEDWKLINITDGAGSDVIVRAVIDLSGTSSVFDNDGPDSPDSGFGVLGAAYLAGTPIVGSFESVFWPDAHNFGDAFLRETIDFAGIGPAGESTTWHDDTDVIAPIPEPGTWLLCGLGVLGVTLRRKRFFETSRDF